VYAPKNARLRAIARRQHLVRGGNKPSPHKRRARTKGTPVGICDTAQQNRHHAKYFQNLYLLPACPGVSRDTETLDQIRSHVLEYAFPQLVHPGNFCPLRCGIGIGIHRRNALIGKAKQGNFLPWPSNCSKEPWVNSAGRHTWRPEGRRYGIGHFLREAGRSVAL
jgi:hypothetical protein